jgi:endogenous inhibitor of DNA gyrase (YacG/DUF329 family)
MGEDQPIKACPICAKPAEREWRPFCSKRCADIDLNKWFKGSYSVPASGDDDEAERPADHETG